MAIASSLFSPSASPVIPVASDWVTGTLFGTVAISLCVLAVAFVGLMLMTGRIAIREAARVVLGCFVLLGASTIALGLQNLATGTAQPSAPPPPIVTELPAPAPLPPANYDPYAGASLRTE